MNLKQISEIVHGRLVGSDENVTIQDLLIDSRQLVAAGQTLFFALKSSRNDGHKYIGELYDNGVRAFVVSQEPDLEAFPEAGFIVVEDAMQALQRLAAWHRQQFDIPVIGFIIRCTRGMKNALNHGEN